MNSKQSRLSRKPGKLAPLEQDDLRDLALAYVAQFSTTRARLADYLQRKICERGVASNSDGLDVAEVVQRLVDLRYVDDEAYARARSQNLLRKGHGVERVAEALQAAGISEEMRNDLAPATADARRAVVAMARKRGFGPFARDPDAGEGLDPATREKQIAAMVRAGHDHADACAIMDASNVDETLAWVEEAVDER